MVVERLEVDRRPATVKRHALEEPLDIGGRLRPGPQGGDGEHADVGEAGDERREGQRFAVGDVQVLQHQDRGAGLSTVGRGGWHW